MHELLADAAVNDTTRNYNAALRCRTAWFQVRYGLILQLRCPKRRSPSSCRQGRQEGHRRFGPARYANCSPWLERILSCLVDHRLNVLHHPCRQGEEIFCIYLVLLGEVKYVNSVV